MIIPVTSIELHEGGRTIFVCNAGKIVMLIICEGRIHFHESTDCAYASLKTPGDIHFCVPKRAKRRGRK